MIDGMVLSLIINGEMQYSTFIFGGEAKFASFIALKEAFFLQNLRIYMRFCALLKILVIILKMVGCPPIWGKFLIVFH